MHDISTGSFGHVIACKDLKQNGRVVAVKVQDRVEAKYHKDFKIEIDILEVVCKRPGRPESVVEMFEYFEHLGRWCIAFETLGPSLYEFQKGHQFRPYPLSAVRDIIRQSIEALAYVHSLELVHTDIKPENICLMSGVARKPGAPANTKIRLIDFGTAEWCAKDGHRNALVSTRQYRAPEVVMGLGWNHVADLWAIGCVLIEMLAGRQIFPTHGDLEQLAMVERVSGTIPQFMINQAPPDVKEMFDDRGRVKSELVAPDRQSRVSRLMLLPNMFPDERDKNLLKLLLYLLTINPRARIPAKQALLNPFFAEGAGKAT
jgi:dual-specificity kinase